MRLIHSLTLLSLALALPAMAQTAPAPAPQAAPAMKDGMHDRMMMRMAEKLKLTDAQKASCKDIIAKHKPVLMAKHQAAKEARRAFFEALQNPATSPDTLKGLNRTAADARLDAMLEGRAMRQELRAVLTPEQREKAAYIMGRRAGMRMGRGDCGMMGGARQGMQCPSAPAKAE
jgi:Spy/CpxP family protein refolding chaperone